MEDVSSDGEDNNYEAEFSDGETAVPVIPVVGRRPYKKRARGTIPIFGIIYIISLAAVV